MDPSNIQALREAGHVKRGHNLRFIGHYDVAQHSWQATMLLYCFHPNPSPALIKAVMFHDVGERYVGDLPAPAKFASEQLAEIHGDLELKALEVLGARVELTDEEAVWAKAVDCLELLLWCEDQLNMGNRHVVNCHHGLMLWFLNEARNLPSAIISFVDTYRWTRCDEQLPVS